MKAGEHGPDELYDKFRVFKAKHLQPDALGLVQAFGVEHELTHREFIFVLRPETADHAAIAALRTYARVCRATYPNLADQIEEKLKEIRLKEIGDLADD